MELYGFIIHNHSHSKRLAIIKYSYESLCFNYYYCFISSYEFDPETLNEKIDDCMWLLSSEKKKIQRESASDQAHDSYRMVLHGIWSYCFKWRFSTEWLLSNRDLHRSKYLAVSTNQKLSPIISVRQLDSFFCWSPSGESESTDFHFTNFKLGVSNHLSHNSTHQLWRKMKSRKNFLDNNVSDRNCIW